MEKLLIIFFTLSTFYSSASTKADHSTWDNLLHTYVSSKGKVNYKGLKSQDLKISSYLKELQEHYPSSDWSRKEKMAYYINLYNAYTVKIVLNNYPVKSVRDIKLSGQDIWKAKLVKTGSKVYSLGYVENEILRKMNDPRVHFAINCASFSCPKLLNHAFTAANLETNLKSLTSGYINNPAHNQITNQSVKISKIFEWYAKDFISDDSSLIDFLNEYSKVKIASNAKIEYIPYNWTLNE